MLFERAGIFFFFLGYMGETERMTKGNTMGMQIMLAAYVVAYVVVLYGLEYISHITQ